MQNAGMQNAEIIWFLGCFPAGMGARFCRGAHCASASDTAFVGDYGRAMPAPTMCVHDTR